MHNLIRKKLGVIVVLLAALETARDKTKSLPVCCT
jgi:hypothetical protein